MASNAEAERALRGQSSLTEPRTSQVAIAWRTVVRVVDGDTLLLDRNERVRLIGVDTPETVDPRRPVQRFGREASAFTKRMAEGKRVRMEYDRNRKG